MALWRSLRTISKPYSLNGTYSPLSTDHTRTFTTSYDHPSNSTNPKTTLFQRLFLRRSLYQSSSRLPDPIFSIPLGDKLRQKLNRNNYLDGLVPLPLPQADTRLSVDVARKLLRISKVEKMKLALRKIPSNSILYDEYVRFCIKECGDDAEQGLEFSKLMDSTGNVIVLGNMVYLRPEQLAKTMEMLITGQMSPKQNDAQREKLEGMDAEMAKINEKAKALVRGEMYCGLGFVILQTMGFMRLTFWELSWDVMEPICFFVTSLHFVAAYAFFLRTGTEPSFEGLFRRRFEVRRKKLMSARGFNYGEYQDLTRVVKGEKCVFRAL